MNAERQLNWIMRRWRLLLLSIGVLALVVLSGYRVDRLWCVACGHREVNRYFFGRQFEHTIITPGTFPLKRRTYQEPYCRAGQHTWTRSRSQFFVTKTWEA